MQYMDNIVYGFEVEHGKPAPWYIKGLKNSSAVKNELSKVNTYEELEKILKDYEQFLDTL